MSPFPQIMSGAIELEWGGGQTVLLLLQVAVVGHHSHPSVFPHVVFDRASQATQSEEAMQRLFMLEH
jgi:hypothetical protein